MLGVEHLGQRNVLAHHRRGVGLGDLLAQAERLAEHPSGVLDRLLGLDRAVGDDLADVVVAVLLGDVADHLAAPALVEVDVEVGHGRTFGVEEALEDQSVRHRVEVGDAQGVGAHRTGAGAASGTHPDAVVLGPVDEVGHHQEIPRIPLARDHRGFELGLFGGVAGYTLGETRLEPAAHLFDEPRLLGLAGRHRKLRHVGAGALVEVGLAALGDGQRVVAGLGQLGPDLPHLGGALQVVAVAVELEPVGGVTVRPGRHAQQRVVSRGIVRVHVMQVVGGDQGQLEVLRDAQQVVADPPLDVEAVVHQLAVEVAGAEDVAELGGRFERLVVLAEPQVGLHLAGGAAGGGEQAFAVAVQQFAVGARLVEEALQRTQRAEPEQVVHALGVLRPHGHVGVGALGRHVVAGAIAELDALAFAAVGLRGEVCLQADDRLHRAALGHLVPLVGAEQVAVIGDRQGRHAHLLAALDQVFESRRAIEHRVLGMAVQMHEPIGHRGFDLHASGGGPGRSPGGRSRGSPTLTLRADRFPATRRSVAVSGVSHRAAPTPWGTVRTRFTLDARPSHRRMPGSNPRRRQGVPDDISPALIAGRSACRGRAFGSRIPAFAGT